MVHRLRQFLKYIFYKYWLRTPKRIIAYIYKGIFRTDINWDNPQTLNEKINWLKIYGDTSQWSELADKFLVRGYVESKGLSDILIPLYGRWKSAMDIDWDALPDSFVLKTNHGCGGVYAITNKNTEDLQSIQHKLGLSLRERYGFYQGEPHYLYIEPQIIAEELLEDTSGKSSSIIDYKVWCFNGEPYCIFVCYNRTLSKLCVECYDLEWNYHPEWLNDTAHIKIGSGIISRPANLDYMLHCARTLAASFPQVRIDLYNINNKVYFGEMTFTSLGGFMTYFTRDALNIMGAKINLF